MGRLCSRPAPAEKSMPMTTWSTTATATTTTTARLQPAGCRLLASIFHLLTFACWLPAPAYWLLPVDFHDSTHRTTQHHPSQLHTTPSREA